MCTPAGGGSMMTGTPHEVAVQNMVYQLRPGRPLSALAFEYARKHGKKAGGIGPTTRLGLVGKTNRPDVRL